MRLYEFILTEARAEALASKYEVKILARAKDDNSANFNSVSQFLNDLESQFGKVVEWVLLRWLQGDFLIEDLPRVKIALDQFEQKKTSIEKKDINQYKTLFELEDAVEDAEEIKSKRQQAKTARVEGLRIIADNSRILLAHVLTMEAAIEVGRGTKWCTAFTEAPNMFKTYNKKGPLYYLYDKQANAKYQIHYEYIQCMDAKDRPYNYQILLQLAPELNQIEPNYTHIHSCKINIFKYIKMFYTNRPWPEAEAHIMKDPSGATQYAKLILNKQRWPEAEPYIMKDPTSAYDYIRSVLNKKRWPEAEPYIMKDAYVASQYARGVLKRRWPEAESVIMKDPSGAYTYSSTILKKKRWSEAEPYIMKDPRIATEYALNVIGGRWEEAERFILRDLDETAIKYAAEVIRGRWPSLEFHIASRPTTACTYAIKVIGKRWKEAEPYIMKDHAAAVRYCKYILEGRWPEAEPYIMKYTISAINYAIGVLGKRWPEAEPYIKRHPSYWRQYAAHFGINK